MVLAQHILLIVRCFSMRFVCRDLKTLFLLQRFNTLVGITADRLQQGNKLFRNTTKQTTLMREDSAKHQSRDYENEWDAL